MDENKNKQDTATFASLETLIARWKDGTFQEIIDDWKWIFTYSARSGYALASGFGFVTHFINREQGLVPAEAVTFCTIQDYIAMLLTRRETPLLHASNGASFGCYDLTSQAFDGAAVERLGMDESFLPAVTAETAVIGQDGGIPVAAAIGDNQASVLGSLRENGEIPKSG